jgi:hypothetical protein
MRRRALALSLLAMLAAAAVTAQTSPAAVEVVDPVDLDDFSRSAALVFRGVCLGAEVGEAVVGGKARVQATTYTFSVVEGLKGEPGKTVTFRQVGTPAGGPLDLGLLAGLPVYQPGTEYVLFLLPPGRSGLTSPAGAAEGAFSVDGETLHRAGPGHLAVRQPAEAAAPAVPLTYGAVRAAVARQERP